jgi:hypothetical protein
MFVSSTLHELADERAVARDATEALRLLPVMFELGGARPHLSASPVRKVNCPAARVSSTPHVPYIPPLNLGLVYGLAA